MCSFFLNWFLFGPNPHQILSKMLNFGNAIGQAKLEKLWKSRDKLGI
jgi:hypothetical protein